MVGVDADASRVSSSSASAATAAALTLDSDYLERRTPSGEPAIQHAYALTTYATEAKTFD